jgi:hypothetical protein
MHHLDKYLRIAETISKLEVGMEITSERQLELDEWLGDEEDNREFLDRIVLRESIETYTMTVAQIDFGKMAGEVWGKVQLKDI